MKIGGQTYAIAVLKPDALSKVLDENILRGFESLGLEIVTKKIRVLDYEQVEQIYAEKAEMNYFPLLVDYMTSNQSMFLVLRGNGEDTVERAKTYRDQARRELKVKRYELTDQDVLLLNEGTHPLQKEITKEMALENLIHVSDNFDEGARVLAKSFTDWDFQELEAREPALCTVLQEIKAACNEDRETTRFLSREVCR